MSKTIIKIWNEYKGALSSAFLDILNREGIKFLLKKLAWSSGGFRGWLVKFVVEEVVEYGDEKLLEPAFRIVGYGLEVVDGKKIYRKVINAQDIDDWSDSVDDV